MNKKNIISTVVLIGAIAISGISTYNVKANADEETLSQVKAELQEQIDSKTKELQDKDKQIEDLNCKVTNQEETINQLNKNVSDLSSAVNNTKQEVNNTKQDLNTAKVIQKQDKEEVTTHTDEGDKVLQQQIDTINEKQDMNVLTQEQKDAMKGENDCVQPEKK